MAQRFIFLSHSSKDAAYTLQFRDELVARGFSVFAAEKHIEIGEDWNSQIAQALFDSDLFVLLLTPDAAASRYVNLEITNALNLYKPCAIVEIRKTDRFVNLAAGFQRIKGEGHTISELVDELERYANRLRLTDPHQVEPRAPSMREDQRVVPDLLRDHGYTCWRIIVTPEGRTPTEAICVLPPMIDVAGGIYNIGTDLIHDPSARADEMPIIQREVVPFAIAKYPVTVAEYRYAVDEQVVSAPGTTYQWRQQCLRLDHPVVDVNWTDAVTYAFWLANITGQGWRIPCESYWEVAARGHHLTLIYPWGTEWKTAAAATNDERLNGPVSVFAHPDGASLLGIQDLVGNVWEWTDSFYTPRVDLDTLEESRDMVVRGGSWASSREDARIARRHRYPLTVASSAIGFRLIRLAALHH